MMRAFSLALIFLTRFPVPVRFTPQSKDWGYSVCFFPVVGLLIGAIMAGCCVAFSSPSAVVVDPELAAVFLLVIWVLITGGLHLDGLADLTDAWIGGVGNREKTLAIMKDPYSGPMGVTALALTLLAKFVGLKVAVAQTALEMLLWIPVIGRTAIVLLLMTTRYVRPAGVGIDHARYLPRVICFCLLLSVLMITIWLFAWDGIILLFLLGAGFIYLRRRLMDHLGGTTGDVLGATCELTETVALLSLAVLTN
jgi:adenosylcobinamide-GDP ribazoletransferase